jgi:transcription antitermination factor NusG
MDEGRKEIEARLVDVERVFSVGDEVKVVAGVYSGVAGHIVQKYDDIFHISQSGTQEEVILFFSLS